MVLTRLWAREVEEGSRRLRVSTLEALGGPERIVRTHLDEALDGLPPEQQEVAAAVFHYLVTPSGSKIGHSAVDLANYTRFSEQRVRAVLAALAAADARIVRALPGPPGLDEEPRYEIFHDVLAPAILGWRAQWSARQQAEAAARRQLEQRARRWRRRQAVAVVLVAVLLAAGAGLAARQVADARTEQEATEAQAAALRQGANAAGVVAARSTRTPTSPRPTPSAPRAGPPARCVPGQTPAPGPRGATPDGSTARSGSARRRCDSGGTCGSRRPSTPKIAPILNAYERGLGAYAVAAALLAAGYTEEGDEVLRRADRTGRDYQRRARRAGFRNATRRCRCSRPAGGQNPRRDSWRGSRCHSLATFTLRSR